VNRALATGVSRRWADRSYRRILIDTHIPDWDPAFLEKFDVPTLLGAIERSGAQAAMIYFQSHVGLCNWPTASGVMHGGVRDPGVLANLIEALHARDIPVCAYYSVHFNNWAYLAHPEWRFEHKTRNGMGPLPAARYGLCCSNDPGYRAFVREQTREIVAGYAVDAVFFDMMWQPGVCCCGHCRTRFQTETGRLFPERLNWLDPAWCEFQGARERWTLEWADELRALVRARRDIDVYHNFAMGVANWSRAQGFESAAGHDFLGGDFYGGREEQLVVCKLMLNLSVRRPIEFMTTATCDLTAHESLKSQEAHDLLAFAAIAHGAAFLAIAACDPDGASNPAVLEIIERSFSKIAPYEPFLGGAPVEEVAVYFSSASKMSFADDGAELCELATSGSTDYPHFHSVRGACRALQVAHIPFGVITRKQIGELARYRVVVLPNVLRMDVEECEAVRRYVAGGGKIYASRLTSLTDASGARGLDFALADVFGASFEAEEEGCAIYVEPASEWVREALAPQRLLSHTLDAGARTGAVRVRAGSGAALATLALPFGHPHPGAVGDENWSSIHSSPPGVRLDAPTLVRNEFGAGETIYAAADIEAAQGVSQALFLAAIKRLLGAAPLRVETNAPACVWLTAFEQDERVMVSLLNYQAESPVLPIEAIEIILRPRDGRSFRRAYLAPGERELALEGVSGGVRILALRLELFAMIIAEYE
jgi:hypothetical protein